MLEASGFPGEANARAFVCGPTPLVEQVAADLVSLGYPEARVKTERFGPTGDSR
jgi:ferredoxin-NADP reductase